MTKYIIKNCPSYIKIDDDWDCVSNDVAEYKCQDCTDCLLKRIAEKCKEECDPKSVDWNVDVYIFAKEILSMLEIEECEE